MISPGVAPGETPKISKGSKGVISFCVWLMWTKRKAHSSQSNTNSTFPVTSSRLHQTHLSRPPYQLSPTSSVFAERFAACRPVGKGTVNEGRFISGARSPLPIFSHRQTRQSNRACRWSTESGRWTESSTQTQERAMYSPLSPPSLASQKTPPISHTRRIYGTIRQSVYAKTHAMRLQGSNRRRLRFLLLFAFSLFDIVVVHTRNAHLYHAAKAITKE